MMDKLAVDLCEYRLKKANDLIDQAKLLFYGKKYDGSINRSYYAIFNAIRAILALITVDSSKHSGVLAYFDRFFVKTRIFDKKFSKIAHAAFDIRQDNDYEDFYIPDRAEALSQLRDAEEFITETEIKPKLFIRGKIKLPKIELI